METVIQRGQNYFKNGSWHKYDLSFKSELSGSYDTKVENDFDLRFNTDSPERYRIENDGKYVEWKLLNINAARAAAENGRLRYNNVWNNADIELTPIPEGIKENIILKNDSAPTFFQFVINTNLDISSDSSTILFSDNGQPVFKVPALYAIDSVKKSHVVRFSISLHQSEYQLLLTVDTSGVKYPIYIDPTTIFQQGSGGYTGTEDTYIYSGYNSDYGADVMFNLGKDSYTYRPLIRFDLSSIGDSLFIESANLMLWAGASESDSIFYDVYLLKHKFYEGTGQGEPANGNESTWNYRRYDDTSWVAAGAGSAGNDYYVSPVTHDTIPSISYDNSFDVDITNQIRLIAGKQKEYPNFGFLLKEGTPSFYNSMQIKSSENETASKRPKLTVTHHLLSQISNISLSALSDSTMEISVDTTYKGVPLDSFRVLNAIDSSALGETFALLKDTIDNLSANSQYRIFVEGYSEWDTVHSEIDTIYTLAQKLDSLLFDHASDSTLMFYGFGVEDNPVNTYFQVYDTTLGKYLSINGTLITDSVWYTKTQWDAVCPDTVKGFSRGQTHTFKARAMNGDSIATAWGQTWSMTVAQKPAPPENLILIPSNAMTLMWSPNSEFHLKGYTVYRSTSFPPIDSIAFVPKTDSTYVDSSVTFGQTYYYWIAALDSLGAESGPSDYVTGYPGFVLSIGNFYGFEEDTLKIPVMTSDSMNLDSIYSFQLHIRYDETVVKFIGMDTSGTLSSGFYTVQVFDTLGVVNIVAIDSVPIPGGTDTVIFLKYVIDVDTGSNAGYSDLIFTSAIIDDDNNFIYTSDGNISVRGLIYGDPSLNDTVTTYDVSLVLQHNVAKKFLKGLQQLVADVSGNGLVTVYDASLILKYTIGMIDTFPAGDTLFTKQAAPVASNASIALSYMKDAANEQVIVDVSLNGAGDNISAIALDIGYPKDKFVYDRYALTKLTEEFMAGVNERNGVVKVGLASAHALSGDGKIIRLYFRNKEATQSPVEFALLSAMLNETKIDVVTGIAEEQELPKTFALSQNYPNPFNPETTIEYQLPRQSFVILKIYNVLGQEIKTLLNEEKDIGTYSVIWDGTNNAGVKVASGVYIYRFHAGVKGGKAEFVRVKKMVFLK